MFLSTTSTRLLNTFSDGHSITSLGSLLPCLINLLVKKFFLTSDLNLPWCNLRPLPLILYVELWRCFRLLRANSLWLLQHNIFIVLLYAVQSGYIVRPLKSPSILLSTKSIQTRLLVPYHLCKHTYKEM